MTSETVYWVRSVGNLWGRSPLSWVESHAALKRCRHPFSQPVVSPNGRIEVEAG